GRLTATWGRGCGAEQVGAESSSLTVELRAVERRQLGVDAWIGERIEEEVSEYIFKAQLVQETPADAMRRRTQRRGRVPRSRRPIPRRFGDNAPSSAAVATQQAMGDFPKVGRNAPCPCGSGKKYKKCHGK
ncbi:MAG: SEC-C metal-binding domain-containing protein, partial [Candidatus Poribacteria bacterium]